MRKIVWWGSPTAKGVWGPLQTAPRGPEQAQNRPYAKKSSILGINSWKLVWKHIHTLIIVWWERSMAKEVWSLLWTTTIGVLDSPKSTPKLQNLQFFRWTVESWCKSTWLPLELYDGIVQIMINIIDISLESLMNSTRGIKNTPWPWNLLSSCCCFFEYKR